MGIHLLWMRAWRRTGRVFLTRRARFSQADSAEDLERHTPCRPHRTLHQVLLCRLYSRGGARFPHKGSLTSRARRHSHRLDAPLCQRQARRRQVRLAVLWRGDPTLQQLNTRIRTSCYHVLLLNQLFTLHAKIGPVYVCVQVFECLLAFLKRVTDDAAGRRVYITLGDERDARVALIHNFQWDKLPVPDYTVAHRAVVLGHLHFH